MTNCNQIKRLIDEAEQPEVMSFEATHHLNACTSCRLFADERASLRALLNGIPRVNAPINFDAQLKARINTAKAKPAFSWLSPALYLRFGAASAVLLIGVFVAQYNGMFSLTNNSAAVETPVPVLTITPPMAQAPGTHDVKLPVTSERNSPRVMVATPVAASRVNHRVQPMLAKLEDDSMSNRVPGVIFRRSSGNDVEVPMLPVSVGAQQGLINRSNRSSVQQIAVYQSF
jgi:hypothetical protein